MPDTFAPQNQPWNIFQKLLFRFCCIYFILYTSPWDTLNFIPGISYVTGLLDKAFEWEVVKCNAHFFQVFHIKHIQPVSNGSGDTSYE